MAKIKITKLVSIELEVDLNDYPGNYGDNLEGAASFEIIKEAHKSKDNPEYLVDQIADVKFEWEVIEE